MRYSLSSLEQEKKIMLITSEKEDSSLSISLIRDRTFCLTINMALTLSITQVPSLQDRPNTDFSTEQLFGF